MSRSAVAAEVKVVSRFEADLLTLLRGILGYVPRSQALALLVKSSASPSGLSRAAIHLVQDTLAVGITRRLAEAGWKRERFLRGEQVVEGRAWQRTGTPELALTFGPQSLDFLIWATASPLDRQDCGWTPRDFVPLTLGDRLLLALALELVRGTDTARRWVKREPWRSDGLCQLLFLDEFAESTTKQTRFEPWLTPAGATVLEAWQSRFESRWLETEAAKRSLALPGVMEQLGRHQRRVLDAYFDAVDRAGRRDLVRWMLPTLKRLLLPGVSLSDWIGKLSLQNMKLADRQALYRHALAVPMSVDRLEQWQQQARGVGYFDEHYQAAQLWKSDWEAYNGDEIVRRARNLLSQNLLAGV